MKKRIVFSKGPDERFARHSEGDFLRIADDGILFVYSRFYESQAHSADHAPCDLVACYSYDEGETWSEPEVVIRAGLYDTQNVMSVSLKRMNNGDVGLFYLVKRKSGYNSVMLSRSRDEGKSYYRHVECTLSDRPGCYIMNNDRALRLSTGRLLLPLAFHRGRDWTGDGFYRDSRTFVCFLYSDDDGETWRESPDVVFPPFAHTLTGLQEPGVIELKNGDLWGYARTDQQCQYEFFSRDQGLHWGMAAPSRFASPVSPMKVARHPETGELYAVWNPVAGGALAQDRPCADRTPFGLAVSRDDGVTWSRCEVLEDDPLCGYCYPAVFFTRDGCMLLAYCAGHAHRDGLCLARLSITKLELVPASR